MFSFLFKPLFIASYITLNFFIALFTWHVGKKFYEEKLVEVNNEKRESLQSVDIHNLYPEFRRYDKFTFMRIFLGLLFLFWIKFSLLVVALVSLYLTLKIAFWNDEVKLITEKKRKIVMQSTKFFGSIALFLFGIIKREKRTRYDEIYKKYLGENYESDFDSKYSAIISNHVSWVEIIYYLTNFAPGFISKDTIKTYPMIGVIAATIDCLFLDRTNIKNRQHVAEEIRIRQESFMKGTVKTPLLIFPEGTVTSGKHILKFKRGAFQNLLPLKPIIVKVDHDTNISLSCGAIKFWVHLITVLCCVYNYITIEEIPVIHPTDFMFENYSQLAREKWQIYAEVVREIYCEVGGFEKSNKTFNDMLDYLTLINGTKISNT